VKRWQRALGDIRILGPDVPKFRGDVKYLYWYIAELEAALREIAAMKSDRGTYDVTHTPGVGWEPQFVAIARRALDDNTDFEWIPQEGC
jgi:hypothetical protein